MQSKEKNSKLKYLYISLFIGLLFTISIGSLFLWMGAQDNNNGEYFDPQTGVWDIPYAAEQFIVPAIMGFCIALLLFFLLYAFSSLKRRTIKAEVNFNATKEYLIKRTDGDWFDLHKDKFSFVLKPNTIESSIAEGQGDHRIKTVNGEISFSYEDPGIQISFEKYKGTQQEMDIIVNEILNNIEQSSGQKGRIIIL